MYITTNALVLRDVPYKESSRILTVLTASEGRITVNARGAKRKGSKTAASTQFLAYSEMTLFHDRGRYTLTEAKGLELFEGLRDDLSLLALGAYFAELLERLSDEDVVDPELLSLGLNALYAISSGKYPPAIVKAAFELRLMCIAGYEPQLDACALCGCEDMEVPVLNLPGGVIHCSKCRMGEGTDMILTPGVLEAMRYIVRAPAKRFCAFQLEDESRALLSKVCEEYLITQLGAELSSLRYYRSVV